MEWALGISVVLTILSTLHMLTIDIPEKEIVHVQNAPQMVDIRGAWRALRSVPGLIGLTVFATFNNLIGGVFMAIMDPYGLTLVSVEVWGILWGVVSLGFIVGGMLVAKLGLTNHPLRMMFRLNMIMWVIGMLFTAVPRILLTAVGLFLYMTLMPAVEAAEQTILQRVVPYEQQGRVFGFSQSIESAAAPITAFLIGPIAQFGFIPWMTTGAGVDLIGDWFGTGPDRGMSLIFIITGVIGFCFTLFARSTKTYRVLTASYAKAKAESDTVEAEITPQAQ
jgi:DHA3 family multidrug efflux protein-like MFS transporter